jgi:hypothetical protein
MNPNYSLQPRTRNRGTLKYSYSVAGQFWTDAIESHLHFPLYKYCLYSRARVKIILPKNLGEPSEFGGTSA